MNQRPEKRISSAWRPEFRRKVDFFDENATESDFERAPSDISAIPTHLDGSRGPVRGQKIQKNIKMTGFGSCMAPVLFSNSHQLILVYLLFGVAAAKVESMEAMEGGHSTW